MRALEGSQRSQAKVSPVYSAPLCWFERSLASSAEDRKAERGGEDEDLGGERGNAFIDNKANANKSRALNYFFLLANLLALPQKFKFKFDLNGIRND